MDEEKFATMKTGSIFINVGRGGTVDTQALKNALSRNTLSGAGLDVFEDEPLSGKAGAAIVELANFKNVVATPHVAYNTRQTTERLSDELLKNIRSCLSGQPINIVH